MVNHLLIMIRKKLLWFLQHKKKHKNTNGAYTDRSKSIGKKVSFVAVFKDITRIGALLTVIKIALKAFHKERTKYG